MLTGNFPSKILSNERQTKQNDICRASDYLLLTKPDTMYIHVYIEVVN